MKYLAIVIAMTLSQFAFAGPGKFDSSEFNDIIRDSQQNEKELQHKLQKNAGIELPKASEIGKISEENRVIEGVVEQIAAKSSDVLKQSEETVYQDDADTMKRVSQEVKEALGN